MSLYFPADGFLLPRRRSLLTPFLTGFAVAAVALAGQTRLGAWLRGFLSSSRRIALGEPLIGRDDERVCYDDLRGWILGRDMAFVVNAFGLPRTVQTANSQVSAIDDAGAGGFWRSNLWYYALDPRTQTAMAIRFGAGVAQQVDFFELSASMGN